MIGIGEKDIEQFFSLCTGARCQEGSAKVQNPGTRLQKSSGFLADLLNQDSAA